MIALLKALHIAALTIWCAGLIVLPMLLRQHRDLQGSAQPQQDYTQFRRLTHRAYTGIATPAAIVAIAAGTALIFAAQVFDLWLLAKLAFVAGMVLAHAWLGHLVLQSSERPVDWRMPWPLWSFLLALPCMAAVLALVLSKPDLAAWVQQLPHWTSQPLGLDLQELWKGWTVGLSASGFQGSVL